MAGFPRNPDDPFGVRFLQDFLRAHGYDPGETNGLLTTQTRQALLAWQRAQKLAETGHLDIATFGRIDEIVRFYAAQAGEGDTSLEGQVRDKAVELYGAGLAAFIAHPEIGSIIQQAAREGRPRDVLLGLLSQTNWWRTTEETARAWEQLKATDPGTANARIAQRKALYSDMAMRIGIAMSDVDLTRVADDALRYGWDDTQVADVLSAFLVFDPARPERGTVGVDMATIKAMAANYLVPIDDRTAFDHAARIQRGEDTVEALEALFRQQASARFARQADVVALIDQGRTPAEIFRSVRETIAQEWQVSAEAIPLADARFGDVLEFTDDKGRARAMNTSEALRWARSQDEFRSTGRADALVADLVNRLSVDMGIRA